MRWGAVACPHRGRTGRIHDQCGDLGWGGGDRIQPGIERIGGRRGRGLFGICEAVVVRIGIGIVTHPIAVGVLPFYGVRREGIKEVDDAVAIGIRLVRAGPGITWRPKIASVT